MPTTLLVKPWCCRRLQTWAYLYFHLHLFLWALGLFVMTQCLLGGTIIFWIHSPWCLWQTYGKKRESVTKWNSGTITHRSVFVLLWKNGTEVKKRNSGTKTHCSVFLFHCGKNGTVVQKNGTVVQKHTVPFFVLLWKKRNRSAKNGTVVQKHTVPFFVPLWKKRNSGAKKNGTVVQNTLFRFLFRCGKNGPVVQKTEQCQGVVCGLWLWYFLIILTYYFCKNGTKWNSYAKTEQ